ncbi:hypothetical protein [Aureimonas pseudogalii]|uniref:Uncharacterized protein n=1 Tax=Aureimonas pseudogalii TaxID=1744844 RepID=A0A7W6E9F1_9HYPH|nr:hypothetical protein [Aureimonas pseudogalii]MBB3997148.1 hypothetical protein [Aureimonas pseudogalii]
MNARSESPTPVLDALENHAGGPLDGFYGGTFGRFLADAATLPIVTLHHDHFAYGDHDDAFPDIDVLLHQKPVWIECTTGIVGGLGPTKDGSVPHRSTGILIEPYGHSRRSREDPWCRSLLSARFCLAGGGQPILLHDRVIIEPSQHGRAFWKPDDEGPTDPLATGLADHERVRFGLVPAGEASSSQLLQMACEVVMLEGRYFRGIPTPQVQSAFNKFPRYAAASDEGVEGLRRGLMASCVERWDPFEDADLDEELAHLQRWANNVLQLGPVIALQALAEISRSGNDEYPMLKTVPLPKPYARGRRAFQIIDTSVRL